MSSKGDADAVGRRCTWAVAARKALSAPTTHEGTVEACVPAGESIHAAEMRVTGKTYSEVDVKNVVEFDRYLVREQRPTGPRKSRKAKRFAPRCSAVKLVKEGQPVTGAEGVFDYPIEGGPTLRAYPHGGVDMLCDDGEWRTVTSNPETCAAVARVLEKVARSAVPA